MPRITGGAKQAQKRKKLLKRACGTVGQPGHNYRSAITAVKRADKFAWIHRRQKKRNFRQLWVIRLNAACRERGVRYSQFIHALTKSGIELNRKMLSELAIEDPKAFDAVFDQVKSHIA
ncbi:MAG: 50S ribosomal protein L20 [Planctomycetota bacterium]